MLEPSARLSRARLRAALERLELGVDEVERAFGLGERPWIGPSGLPRFGGVPHEPFRVEPPVEKVVGWVGVGRR